MRNRLTLDTPMPSFWPPRPSPFWSRALAPLHRLKLRLGFRVSRVEIRGLERLKALPPSDGALLCPNHSYAGDGGVLVELGRRTPRPLHILAAWQLFAGHGGLDGWLLQRLGCFSVDREGADRRALKEAVRILTSGGFLAVFPEGENYHLNERLTPLREGVAFMAASAQRELADRGRAWLVPVAIRYRFAEDVTPALHRMLRLLEWREGLNPRAGAPLAERVLSLGNVLLTREEHRVLGRKFAWTADPLHERIRRLAAHLLEKHEQRWLQARHADDPTPVRVKRLRARLLELPEEERGGEAREALADLHLAIQLFSYPGDYVLEKPTVERMAETVEKFQEDVCGGEAAPIGTREAVVTIGAPIDVRAEVGEAKLREAVGRLTERLEGEIRHWMGR